MKRVQFSASEMARLRNAAWLSQPALAKRLNYSASQVTKIETCQRIPKQDLAARLDENLDTGGARRGLPERAGRDSKDQAGPELAVGDRAWSAFVRGVKQGEFGL